MIISPKGYKENVEVYYWLGKFDKINYHFIPDNEEPQYWDYGIKEVTLDMAKNMEFTVKKSFTKCTLVTDRFDVVKLVPANALTY